MGSKIGVKWVLWALSVQLGTCKKVTRVLGRGERERERERKELVVVAACIFARLSMPINTIFFARTHAHLIACSQPHLATQKPMSRGK